MPVAIGERELLGNFEDVRTRSYALLRDMPVDALTASAADKLLDHVIAIEKAMTGIRLLIVKRAAEGETWRTRGARSAADDLAKRMGASPGQAKDVLNTSKQLGDQSE